MWVLLKKAKGSRVGPFCRRLIKPLHLFEDRQSQHETQCKYEKILNLLSSAVTAKLTNLASQDRNLAEVDRL
jgi:hypothetical protein